MIDLDRLQEDLFGLLLAAPVLNTVNVVLEKKLLSDSQVELDTVWSNPRNGRSGNGILVEEIVARVNSSSTLAQDLDCTFVAFQNGDAAFTPETGGGFGSPNLAQVILDVLNRQAIGGIGTLQAIGQAPANDYEGINATRATLRIIGVTNNAPRRCAQLGYTLADDEVTLTCATAGAEIYYTLDGSLPLDPAIKSCYPDVLGNFPALSPNAQRYTAPFAVTSGQRLRAAAYAFGFHPSEILHRLIP